MPTPHEGNCNRFPSALSFEKKSEPILPRFVGGFVELTFECVWNMPGEIACVTCDRGVEHFDELR